MSVAHHQVSSSWCAALPCRRQSRHFAKRMAIPAARQAHLISQIQRFQGVSLTKVSRAVVTVTLYQPEAPRLRSWEDCYIWRMFTEIVTVAIRHTSHACRTTGFRLRIRRLAVATTSQAKGAGLRLTASELLFLRPSLSSLALYSS